MELEDMNDPWYNNIVNEDFDGDYENIMNCVEEQKQVFNLFYLFQIFCCYNY